jgi:hypothetical protein
VDRKACVMKRNRKLNRRYLVRVNFDVDAAEWWRSARDAALIPTALVAFVFGLADVAEIDEIDLRWCRELPMWDGIDGTALRVKRVN